MASINSAVNIKKLLAEQQAAIIANTDAKSVAMQSHVSDKTTETKTHVTTKATETKSSVNTNISAETLELDNSVATLATSVDALPLHITNESDRVLASIPESKNVNFQTDGKVIERISAGQSGVLYSAPEIAGKFYRVYLLTVEGTANAQDGISFISNGVAIESNKAVIGTTVNTANQYYFTIGGRSSSNIQSIAAQASVYDVIECNSFSITKSGGATAQIILLAYEIGEYK